MVLASQAPGEVGSVIPLGQRRDLYLLVEDVGLIVYMYLLLYLRDDFLGMLGVFSHDISSLNISSAELSEFVIQSERACWSFCGVTTQSWVHVESDRWASKGFCNCVFENWHPEIYEVDRPASISCTSKVHFPRSFVALIIASTTCVPSLRTELGQGHIETPPAKVGGSLHTKLLWHDVEVLGGCI